MRRGRSNRSLSSLLHRARGGADAGLRTRLFTTLLSSTLVIETAPAPESPDGWGLVVMRSSDGRRGLSAFTSPGLLRSFRPGCEGIASVPAREFFRMALESSVDAVLLDMPLPGWEISPGEIAELAAGRVPTAPPVIRERMVRVHVSAPMVQPSAAELSLMRAQLEPHPEILAAYVVSLTLAGAPARLCVSILLRDGAGSYDEVCAALDKRDLMMPDSLGGREYLTGPLNEGLLVSARRDGVRIFDRAG